MSIHKLIIPGRAEKQCPPCTAECNQGRNCPARSKQRDADIILVLLLVLGPTLVGVSAVWGMFAMWGAR